MITNIHIEHYKAFEKADVPIKPITILLGANSVGKSSIIQLLLAMEQTATADLETYSSCLKLYGSSVNLGSAENLFHRFETKKPVVFSFSINSDVLFTELHNALDEYLEDIKRPTRFLPVPEFKSLANKETYTKQQYLRFVKRFKTIIDKKKYKEIKDRLRYYPLIGVDDIMYDQLLDSETAQLEKLFDFLDGLKNLSALQFDFEFKISHKERSTLQVDGFSLSCNGDIIFSYSIDGKKVSVSSGFIAFDDREKKNIEKSFNKNSTLFSCFNSNDELKTKSVDKDIVSCYVLHVVNTALLALRAAFKTARINHVSPLRAHPKRYYMLDKANVTYSLDTLDGDAIAEVLKENKGIKNKVNKWLDNFKLSVDVEEFKEVIHHLKVKQNGLSLDITDVGFGISQILPIIIQGFLSRSDSLTIIEQPEIHLHPKMQADLADLFIDMVKASQDREIIVETHSEYLLRRLRRRISEGKISPEKVSICLFHPQTPERGAEIEHLGIEKNGGFEWPEDYYDGELSKDITEFLKNQ